MKAHRRLWMLFAAGALIVMIALSWVTVRVLELEQREAQARADAQYQEALRLALWRMDSWFSPRLAREAARPYFEYLSYYPQERAYTRILNRIEKGEVLTPSPLLTFTSEYFPLHFQIDADDLVTSPQVPVGSQRDLSETTLLGGDVIDAHAAALDALRPLVTRQALAKRIAPVEERLVLLTCEMDSATAVNSLQTALPMPQTVQVDESQSGRPYQSKSQVMMTQEEQTQRWVSSNMAQKAAIPQQQRAVMEESNDAMSKGGQVGAPLNVNYVEDPEPQITVGPLVPLWLDAQQKLVFVRRVLVGPRECFQGFVTDWPRVRSAMLEQVTTLIAGADLAPLDSIPATDQFTGRELATIPAKLQSTAAAPVTIHWMSPTRFTLSVTWLAVLGAIFAAGVTLRASIHYGEKRSRFASAVTHELRTPLTTFRMYSEMLAEGMVKDESQRRAYLETLKSESGRLATLVENVLGYARLEEGRFASHAQKTTLREMFARLTPVLQRRATDAGMELEVRIGEAPTHQGEEKASRHQGIKASRVDHTVSNPEPLMPGCLDASMPSIVIDTETIGQILFNLVDNACKYANGSQTHDRTIHIDAATHNGDVRIEVRDHGPGVPPEHSRNIFTAFERGVHSAGDAAPIPGVGLGLALSRGLARDMGGDLRLDDGHDPPERGARFVLSIPAVHE